MSLLFQKLRRERPTSQRAPSQARLQENEWFLSDLAAKLVMAKSTLAKWIKRGWVHVPRQLPGYCGKLICWADADELDRLRRLRACPLSRNPYGQPYPADLMTPKPRATVQ